MLCPECRGEVAVVEVSEEGAKAIQRAVEAFRNVPLSEKLDFGQSFEIYYGAAFSRVLSYLAMKFGVRAFKPNLDAPANESSTRPYSKLFSGRCLSNIPGSRSSERRC